MKPGSGGRTRSLPAGNRLGLFTLIGFVLLAFLLGGASRADALSQLIVRLLALGALLLALTTVRREQIADVRLPLAGLGLLGAVMVLQLVPLPPALWTALPGRDLFAEAAPLAGLDQPWRPISLVPHRTWNSLLALLPGLAAIICFAVTPAQQRQYLLWLLAGFIFLSAIVGLLQISTGRFYPYRVTNYGAAVGLLANRNHQAALLSLFVPIIATIIAMARNRPLTSPLNLLLAAGALFILPLVLATGSRAGIVLAIAGVVAGGMILLSAGLRRELSRTRFGRYAGIGLAAALVLVIGLTIWFSRDVAVQRLLAKDLEADYRLTLFWPMVDVVKQLSPFGAGFGTFNEVFRVFEPREVLGPEYFNHAHNDLLEIGIEAGLFGYLVIAAGLVAWVLVAQRLWRSRARGAPEVLMGRLGCVITLLLALASMADYPLRTPTGSLLFLLGWCMMYAGLGGGSWREETR